MRIIDLDEINCNISNEDPALQAAAFEKIRTSLDIMAKSAVNALRDGPNKFIVAERLHWIGAACIPYLQDLVGSADLETRVFACIVLLQLGSRIGVTNLIQVIESNSEYAGLAAMHLSKNKIIEAVPAILGCLGRTDVSQVDLIVGLVKSLRSLRVEIPDELQAMLADNNSPWQVQTLFNERVMRQP